MLGPFVLSGSVQLNLPKGEFIRIHRVGPFHLNGSFNLDVLPKGKFLRAHRMAPFDLIGFLQPGLCCRFFAPYKSRPVLGGWWRVGRFWVIFFGINQSFCNML